MREALGHNEEVEFLRARVAELERVAAGHPNPVLASFLENHSAFFSLIDPAGRFLATGRVADAYGSVVGRSIYEFMPESARQVTSEALAKACKTLAPVNYEMEGAGEDGTPGHHYQVRAVPIAKDGQVDAIVLVPTDITDRVRLERSLADAHASLRLAVAATGMGFWYYDLSSDEVTWDRRMLEMFGVAGVPPDYATYVELVHPDDRDLVQSAVRQALESGVYPTIEHRIRKQGSRDERWILGAAAVERDAHGKPLGIRGGALDITDRKNLTRQMERAERVQAVGQLAAGIAHNFNNLLAVILPGLAMALETPTRLDDEMLSASHSAALRARDLVKNLFSLTAESAKSGETSDLLEAVRQTLQICRAHFPRQIDLELEQEFGPLWVPLSPSDLEHLVLNLLTNARDALEARPMAKGLIHIRVGRSASDPHTGELSVSDNGMGMTPETRRRIFEPFFTTKGPERGTGLGLATVAARVRSVGGTVDCKSAVGEGTTVVVRLPLSATGRRARGESAGPARGKLLGRALIVDDERMVRATLRRLLELWGLEVQEASSAFEARTRLGESKFDLIILDDSMPTESGIQALGALQALSRAPILLFTGYAAEVPPGIAAYLSKPAAPDELLSAVRTLLASPDGPPAGP